MHSFAIKGWCVDNTIILNLYLVPRFSTCSVYGAETVPQLFVIQRFVFVVRDALYMTTMTQCALLRLAKK